MLTNFILKKLDAVEKEVGQSMDYLRHMVRVSPPAFFKFAKIMPISNYRRRLPKDAYYVARLVATRDEDCGTCVQIEVNLALQQGVPAETLQAVVADQPDQLSGNLQDVYKFTKGVVQADGTDEAYRERITDYYGEEGLVELALAIASSRFFPIAKRTLGYSKSCNEVEIRYERI